MYLLPFLLLFSRLFFEFIKKNNKFAHNYRMPLDAQLVKISKY